MRILKFGGTSVSKALPQVVEIVRNASASDRIVVVVSALAGVTETLNAAIANATARERGYGSIVANLRASHREHLRVATGAGDWNGSGATVESWLARLGELLDGIALLRHCSPETRDAILGIGERLATPLVTEALRLAGVDVASFDAAAIIRTDDRFGSANVDFETTARLARLHIDPLGRDTVAVVTGFVAATRHGASTTLGRGGSDYSAAILADALGADRVEIWTDVDGISSADPRLVSGASTLPRLSFREAAALAGAGAKVLHPRTIAPLEPRGVPVAIRNTFRPDAAHTVVGLLESDERPCVKAITASASDASLATVTLVGEAIGRDVAIALRALDALRAARIAPRTSPLVPNDDSIAIAVDADDCDAAVRVLHDELILDRRLSHLVLAGATGRVGTALRGQIAALAHGRTDLRIIATANSRFTRFAGDCGSEKTDWEQTIERLARLKVARLTFVDCTASAEVASLYARLLGDGIGVVTPNKIASAGTHATWSALRTLAREHAVSYRHETTVGAALPLLRTISDLVATGDRLVEVQGVLSGTLSFLLAALHEGRSFSEAVAEAFARGLTEPDPGIDLSGVDVARKLLILVREAGVALEMEDVNVEALVSPPLAWDGSIDRYTAALRTFDDAWRVRVAEAETRGERLVYAARYNGTEARAGVVSVAADHPLARVRPGENVIVIRTERYDQVPLTIAGPGAGPEVTAAGVLAEILA